MPKPITEEETEHIRDMIEDGDDLEAIMKATERGRTTVFAVAKEHNLTITPTPKKGIGGAGDPYVVSDGVVLQETKNYIKSISSTHLDDIMKMGTVIVELYLKRAHEKNVSVADYIANAVQFFEENILMVETADYVIEQLGGQVEELKAQLSTMGIMRGMVMELMREGRNIDFNQIINAAKALNQVAMENDHHAGRTGYENESVGSEVGGHQRKDDGRCVEHRHEPDDTNDLEYSDEPTEPGNEHERPDPDDGVEDDDGIGYEAEPGERGDEGDASHPEPAPGGQETGEPGATVRDDSGQPEDHDGDDPGQ